ncbi:MAG: DUF7601 domain-containing protein [Lachnospiraceae bacterium]
MQKKQGNQKPGKRKRGRSLMALAAVVFFVFFLSLSAASGVSGAERGGTLTIRYQDLDGEPVAGAEFSLRLIAEPVWDGSFHSLLPLKIDAETEPSEIVALAEKLPARTFSTAEDGNGRVEGLVDGLYLVEETSPAAGHFASVPFFAAIPSMREGSWNFDVEAEPKPLAAGSLRIQKTVTGAGGEKERKFSFRIQIGAEGEFPVTYSTGDMGTVKTGGIVALRHGESATVSMLPAGTVYKVEELEDGENGYQTEKSGEKGNIVAKKTAEAIFVNDRGATPTPSLPPQYPPQTGDTSNAGYYAALALTAAVALAAVLFGRRKTS